MKIKIGTNRIKKEFFLCLANFIEDTVKDLYIHLKMLLTTS